jgi:hypothetical protein
MVRPGRSVCRVWRFRPAVDALKEREEDMERPRLLRRLVLGLGTLLLGTSALACLRSWARESERPPEDSPPLEAISPWPDLPQEALRYDGKSFNEWRTILMTDLKPEKRIEAITALTAFGTKGYADEATAALLQGLKRFSDDTTARCAAIGAIDAVDHNAKGVTAALIAALKDKDDEVRCQAAEVLGKIGPDAKAAAPLLIAMIKDSREWCQCRQEAFKALGKIKAVGPALVPTLGKLLKDGDEDIRCQAILYLGEVGPREAMPAIKELLRHVKRYESFGLLRFVESPCCEPDSSPSSSPPVPYDKAVEEVLKHIKQ